MEKRVWHGLLIVPFLASAAIGHAAGCAGDDRTDNERFTVFTEPPQNLKAMDFEAMAEEKLKQFRTLWCDHEYGDGLAGASDPAVSIRVRAARSAAFHAPRDWVLERYRAALQEAHARDLARREHYRDLSHAYQSAGQYDRARQLREDYPDAGLREVPDISRPPAASSADDRLIWRVRARENRLVGEWVTLDGPRLLIVSSPTCSFCKAAARELLQDDVLAPLMREHALWLARRSMNNDFHRLAAWNESHPDALIDLVDDEADWPIPGFYSTPRFHFLDDGEVVETLAGWRDGSEALGAIAEGFDKLGLLDAESLPADAFAHADRPSKVQGCPARDRARKRIRERAPVVTREDMEAHLDAIAAGAESPLEQLSSEGRERLIASIRYGSHGIAGFRHDDVRSELESKEIYELASFFGVQYMYADVLFDSSLLSDEERELRAMLNCSGEYGG